MHFSNPNTFKLFGKEIQNRSIMMEVQDVGAVKFLMQKYNMPLEEAIKTTGLGKDNYYELKDGKLSPIDTDEFSNNGKIVLKDGAKQLDYNKDTKKNYRYINEIEPSFTRILKENLNVSRINSLAEDVYNRISKSVDPEYAQQNKNLLKNLSWTIATSKEIGSAAEGFRKNRLPENADIQNKIIDLSNGYQLPYRDVEKYVLNNLPQYFENPERFGQAFMEESGGYKTGLPLPQKFLDTVQSTAETIAKSIQEDMARLTFGSALKPKTAESVARWLDMQNKARGTELPSSGLTYFDSEFGLLPVKVNEKKNTATIVVNGGKDIEMSLDAVKSNIKTGEQVAEEQKVVKEKKVSTAKVNKIVEQKIAEAESKGIKLTDDEINQIKKEVQSGQEQVGINKDTQVSASGGKDTEGSSGTSAGNVESNAKGNENVSNEAVNEQISQIKPTETSQTSIEKQGEAIIPNPIDNTILPKIEPPNAPKEEILVEKSTARTPEDYVKEQLPKFYADKTKEGVKVTDKMVQEEKKRLTNEYVDYASKQITKSSPESQALDQSVKGLTELMPADKLELRNKQGQLRPEVLQRLKDIRDKADLVTANLKKVAGNKVRPEDTLITALEPYFKTRDMAQLLAIQGYNSGDALKNETFIKNRLKKLGISTTKQTGQTGNAEIGKTGMTEVNASTLKPVDTEIKPVEQQIIDRIKEIEPRIAELVAQKFKVKNDPEASAKIDAELNPLLQERSALSKRYNNITEEFRKVGKDEVLTDPESIRKEVQQLEEHLRKSGLDIPIQQVESIQTPSGNEAAGSYVRPTGNFADDFFKMNTKQTLEGTGSHEFAELAMKRMGETDRWNQIIKQYGGDKEKVADAFAEYARTHKEVDTSTVFGKLKHFFNTIADFAADKLGWGTKASYFRRLADGTLKLKGGLQTTPPSEDFNTIKLNVKDIADALGRDDYIDESKILSNYEALRETWGHPLTRKGYIQNNILVRKGGQFLGTLGKASIQTRNYAYQMEWNPLTQSETYKHPVTQKIYDAAERMILNVANDINTIREQPEGWNSAKNFLEMGDRQLSYTSKYGVYSNAIADGKREPIEPQRISEGETLKQFIERAGNELDYTPEEKAMEERYQIMSRQTQDKAREGFIQDWKDKRSEDGKVMVADMLSERELKKYFGDKLDYGKTEEELYKDANNILETDNALLDNIVQAKAQNVYPKYYGLYRDEVRPSNPNYWMISGYKPVDANGKVVREDQAVRKDRIESYGENEKEAREIANKYNAEGYAITTFDQIGKLVSTGQYDKLTANQLMNLADIGHVETNTPYFKALLSAIKTGNYAQHTIGKEYIKGMHYTPEEFEKGAENLIRESVNASTKKYALANMRGMLASQRAETNRFLKSPSVTDYQKDKKLRDLEYATKIYNQVSKSDQSFVDNWRKAATAWYIGVKPSFWFQQMMQPLQTTLPEAIKEGKTVGLSGSKLWFNAFDKAFEMAKVLKAEKVGEPIQHSLDKEFIDVFHRMDKENLMGAVGIEELAGQGSDLNMRYGSDLYKSWNKMLKVVNMGGAMAEKFTRIQALSTFYEIGKAKGLAGDALHDYLVTNVKNVMSGWGALDRPALTQSKQLGVSEQTIMKALSKSFFTFKTYSNANLGQYDRLFRGQHWGALGTKLLVGTGMHGITKFPMLATLFAITNLFTDKDTEYEALKLLDELDNKVGGKFGSIIAKGVPELSGINMQNLFDERSTFATDVYSETRSKSVEGKIAEAMFGAPYGLAKDAVDASVSTVKLLGNLISGDMTLDQDEKDRAKKNLMK
ncbi:MAG: hypothetical protein ACYC2U_07865, partial [Candidatus Amoebophilus sp.]